MRSLILCTVSRFITPILLLVSLFLLIRGHNSPGGGFIAGLMAASAFCLYMLAYGIKGVREAFYIDPKTILGLGLFISILSGIIPMFTRKPFLTGLWINIDIPTAGTLNIGTPFLFDIGVFLVVIGMVTSIILGLGER